MSAADHAPPDDAGTGTAEGGAIRDRRVDPAAVTISVTLLAVFLAGLVLAAQWSFRAALTPLLVSGVGAALSGLYLGRILTAGRSLTTGRGGERRAERADDRQPAADIAAPVFATADRRSWGIALLWVAGFFLATYTVGLLVTGACFALAYLRLHARASWRAGLLYAAALGITAWLVFDVAFEIALPEGLLG